MGAACVAYSVVYLVGNWSLICSAVDKLLQVSEARLNAQVPCVCDEPDTWS